MERILVIQHKMIGDVLTSSVLFEVLRKEYPKAQLEYLINENTLPVVANNPFIDEVHSYLPALDENARARKAFYYDFQKENYDLVIDVYAKLRSAILTRSLRAKQSVSYYKWYTSFCYKRTVRPKSETNKDEGLAITNRLLLLDALKIPYSDIPKPRIFLTESEKLAAKSKLVQSKIDFHKPVFMIGIFGSNETKTYPLSYMAKVLDHLIEQTQGTLLFNYIPSQKDGLEQLLQMCSVQTRAHSRTDLYGEGLREFMALCSQCKALIGNEGGAVNMAKALDVPSFSIFSPWILKSAWNSYEASGDNASVHLSDFRPELYKKHPKEYKNRWSELYRELLPEFVIDHLDVFLKHHDFKVSRP